jgi:riboflavin biosynthesis pyrimidine reductase
MDEIRANALYKLTSDYSVSVLQEWREEGGSICHLLEVTAGNTEYANGLLRMNVIDEIILYVVPTIDGNGAHFFKSALPMNDWRLMENKTYRDGVIRLTYHKEPRA